MGVDSDHSLFSEAKEGRGRVGREDGKLRVGSILSLHLDPGRRAGVRLPVATCQK